MLHVFANPLFHGTVDRIEAIDLSHGQRQKDFGRGFYLALSARQAIGMMHKKRREKLLRMPDIDPATVVERLYRVQLKTSAESTLKIKVFEKVDLTWLEFILSCREAVEDCPHDFDVVVGPTADDDTMAALKLYRKGLYGPVGSDQAKTILLGVLEPENLGVQCCLCTPAAVASVQSMSLVDWRMIV